MSEPFLAEIRLVPFTFAPTGWAFCDGQLLPIAQNTALFALLGTTYGGNGMSNFALPNLQGQVALGTDAWGDYPLGTSAGAESVSLLTSEMPAHTHTVQVTAAAGTTGNPTGASFAMPRVGRTPEAAYGGAPAVPLHPAAIAPTGSGLPHNNMQPYLVLNYIIAMQGVFPPRP
ncbi:tail fiber protein [uncultured Leifsonia sp.]|uniref:phage tail protein n=1 Tax=Leifsonia sp. TaxID=1870902 RepID=UPI0028D7962A|nr:tail fiber protein [uncultured Leifsonia sp.]